MIPSARLIWLVAAVGFPAMLVDVLMPDARAIVWVVLASIGAAAIVDALVRERGLAGVEMDVPPLVRAVQGIDMNISVRMRNASQAARRVRVGFVMPEEVEAAPEDQWLSLPAGEAMSSVDWAFVPRLRGTFHVRTACLEAGSPLGFWATRKNVATSLEIRVYPNLRHARALSALRRGVENRRVVRQIGRGREFEKLREFSPGDSSDEIHWKASARRARPITKVFQIERAQEVFAVIDAGRLSGRKIDGEAALDRAINACLILNAVTARRGDLFGVAAFSDRVEAFVPAGRGATHYAACRDAVNNLRPRDVSPDFEEAATFLSLRLRKRSLLLFLTSLDDPILAERFARATRLLAQRHLVVAGMVKPALAQPLFSDASVESTNDIYCALAGHLGWRQLREVQRGLARQGVQLSLLHPNSFTSGLMAIYDDVKQRQLL